MMPILIDPGLCRAGCTICDVFCPGDIIYREDKTELPVVKYPDECWYCGACALHCPADAITILFPPEMLNCQTDVATLVGAANGSAGSSAAKKGAE